MKAEMNRQAEQYIRQNKNKRKVTRLVAILSVLVALLTTYILMLPGITMEYGMVCGLEEHQHSEACYAAGVVCGLEERETVTTETVSMVCSVSPHEHSSDCFDSNNERICGMATELFHTHNDFCYDGEGKLICTLPGNAKHVHSESCYQTETQLTCQLEETAGHRHTEACKTQTAAAEPACGLAESAGHAHGDSCFAPDLSCSLAESAGHIHEESCHQIESTLVCTEAEAPAHSHEATCYNEQNELICGMEAGQGGHTHGESCYTQTDSLICGKEEGEGTHTHGDDCYTSKLICTIADGEGAHTHTESCYPMVETITCGMEAGQGAHAHGEACYTASEQLVCTLLHQHDGECVEKDNEGRECVICGMDEVPEHIHTENCREVTTSTIEGHTHTDECNGDVLVCQLTEHTHEDACYPQEEVVVTATPEPSATPEVSSEPTAEPTTGPASLQDDTTYLCGIPEHRHSATCLDEAGTLICGYAEDHLHGELCLADLTDTVFYCGTEEHLHGFLCFGENNQLLCGVEEEHRHSYECLKDPSAITACYCGMEEHFHGELCYDENWALVCQATEHFHSADCYYACGKQEHVHSATAAGGMMLLSLEESYGCYDAEGKLVCGLEEHTHSEACNTVGMVVQNSRNDQLMTLEETATDTWSRFGQYVTTVTRHMYGSGNNQRPADVQYNPDIKGYKTAIDINFTIQPDAFQNNQYDYQYYLPEHVEIVADMYDKAINITEESGSAVIGQFYIRKDDEGKNYLEIKLDSTQIDVTTACSGKLFFECAISEEATDNNGDISVRFEDDAPFEVNSSDITRPAGETAKYSLDVNKTGGNQNAVYDAATNTLTYQISVKTKGTPGEIVLADELDIQLNQQSITLDQSKIQIQSVTNSNGENVTDYQYQFDTNNQKNNLTFTLPQATKEEEYKITYQVTLDELGFKNMELNATNKLNGVSHAPDNPNDPNKVSDSSPDVRTTHNQSVLKKGVYAESDNDALCWNIEVNASRMNINGLVLTDDMFGSIIGSLEISPSTGYEIQKEGDKIIGIEFTDSDGSDGVDANHEAYSIRYRTTPQFDYPSSASESNTAKLTNPEDPNTALEEETATIENYTRKQNVYKTATGTVNEDKTKLDIAWDIKIEIDSNGLSNPVTVTDQIQIYSGQWMMYDQMIALYDAIDSLIVPDSMYVKYLDEHGNPTNESISINTIRDNSSYAGKKFAAFTFVLDPEKVNQHLNNSFPALLEFDYHSTADISSGNNATHNNQVTVGNKNANASYTYVANPVEVQKVNKYCPYCGKDRETTCGQEHNTPNDIRWAIDVFQDQEYNSFTVADQLPSNTKLKEIKVSGVNGHPWIILTPETNADGSITWKQSTNGDTSDVTLTPAFDSANNSFQIQVNKRTDGQALNTYMGFGANQTMRVEVVVSSTEALQPETRYEYLNTATVTTSDNSPYGQDSHTHVMKTPKSINKSGVNGGVYSEDSISSYYDPSTFGWKVEVKQLQDYQTMEVTDTLPDGLILTQIKVGDAVIPVSTDETGTISFGQINNNGNQQGLDIVAETTTSTEGKKQVTITISRKANGNVSEWDGFGSNKTMNIQYSFSIPDDQLPSSNKQSVTLEYQNHAQVKLTPSEGEPFTDADSQKQTLNLTYSKPVIKSGENTVVNSTGDLVWNVSVKQDADYGTITITDTLPEGIELRTVAMNGENNKSFDVVMLFGGRHVLLGESTDGGKTYPLQITNIHYTADEFPSYEAIYHADTGEVVIRLKDGQGWRGKIGDSIGKDKTLNLVYYCKVSEENMPDNDNGEYFKDMVAYTNNVTVEADDVTIGSDSHTQEVTIQQTPPAVVPADKAQPKYDKESRVLHYSLDINRYQHDMDTAKSSVTVTDTLTYNADPNRADRKITLIPDTVKLYYAQTNENGRPILEDGRLVIGDEVDTSKWTMEYAEDDTYSYQTKRTMTLSVPDECALVLVYDYQVSMTDDPQIIGDNGIELGVKNTVQVEGYANDQSTKETQWSDKWEKLTAGGSAGNSAFTMIKHDASNLAKVLAGVSFKVQKYDTASGWTDVDGTFTTNEQGKATLLSKNYDANTLYRVVETQTNVGYIEPSQDPDRDTILYFYYPKNDTDGQPVTIPTPVGFALDTQAYNLNQSGQTVYVPNQRKSTTLNVQKKWLKADLTTLDEHPDSVTVELRRYAVPVDTWDQLVANNPGINGEQTTEGTLTDVTIKVRASDDAVTHTTKAAIGSTLTFRVSVNRAPHGHLPQFSGYQPVDSYASSANAWYDYSVVVTENLILDGTFSKSDGQIWGGFINSDYNAGYVTIDNVQTSTKAPPDNAGFTPLLQEYADNSYSQTLVLRKENNWNAQWNNLPYEGLDAHNQPVHYKYYVTEVPPSGYTAVVNGYSSDNGGNFVVKNIKDGSSVTTTNLLVEKEWYNSNGEQYIYNSNNDSWTLGNTTYQFDGTDWYTLGDDGNKAQKIEDQNLINQLPLSSVSVQLVQTNLLSEDKTPKVYIYGPNEMTAISSKTGWIYKFTNLPAEKRDGNGIPVEKYDYFIKEVENDGQFAAEPVFVEMRTENGREYKVVALKNAAIRQDITVGVTKEWEGGTPADVSSVTVRLDRLISTSNGYVVDTEFNLTDGQQTEVQLDGGNNWHHDWKNLVNGEITADGVKSYSYQITEIKVNDKPLSDSLYEASYSTEGGRVSAGETLIITNAKAGNETAISVKKVWQDTAGKTMAAPENATVTLNLMRRAGESAQGEPVYVDGQPIEITLPTTEENLWQTTIEDLPKFAIGEDGSSTEYIYYVEETNGPAGFTVSYSNSADGENFTAPENSSITVTNTLAATTVVGAKKVWKNSDGTDMPAPNQNVQLQLYKVAMTKDEWQAYVDGLQQNETPETPTDPVIPEGHAGITFDFYHSVGGNNVFLGSITHPYKENEQVQVEIAYSGSETINSFQAYREQKDDVWYAHFGATEKNAKYLVITLKPEDIIKSNITVETTGIESIDFSKWSVKTVSSPANASQRSVGGFTPPVGERTPVDTTINLPDGTIGNWSYQWPEQPLQEGDIYYAYYVEETNVSGYTTTYDATYDMETGTYSFTVTNTKNAEQEEVTTTDLTIRKVWVNADEYKPDSIAFIVERRDEQNTSVASETYSVQVSLTGEKPVPACPELEALGATLEIVPGDGEEDGWTLNIKDLQDTLQVGNIISYDYSYAVTEAEVDGFQSERYLNENTGEYTFTNTLTGLLVKKAWVGGEGGEVQFNLWRRAIGEPTGTKCSGGCDASVSSADEHKLDCGHYTCQLSIYDAAEHAVCACGASYVCQDGHGAGECNGSSGEEMVEITLKYRNPSDNYEKVFGPIEVPQNAYVVWKFKYEDGWYSTPDQTVSTFAYGEETVILTAKVLDGKERELKISFRATHSGEITWSMEDNKAPKPDSFESIEYTITPATLSTRNTLSTSTINTDGAEMVTKSPFTLNSTNEWTHFFTGLDATATDGRPYHYFVEEVSVPEGYTVSYSTAEGIPPEGGTIIITNTKETPPEPETISLTVKKEWLNADGLEMENKPNYTVHYEIWADDTGAIRPGLSLPTEDNQWEATHTGLPAGGTYYVKEISVTDGNSEMKDLYSITYTAGDDDTASLTPEGATLSSTGSLTITNKLKPTYVLPETGGTGTHLYTCAGALLAGLALMLLYRNNQRKRRANE